MFVLLHFRSHTRHTHKQLNLLLPFFTGSSGDSGVFSILDREPLRVVFACPFEDGVALAGRDSSGILDGEFNDPGSFLS